MQEQDLHGSLLPKYRGAAPIHWAIINGEKETGVTTFFLQHEIDTGDIIQQRSLAIGPDETTGEVHDRMMEIGAEVVLETVNAIRDGVVQTQPQSTGMATHAPKIFTETCEINFNQPTIKVHNFIRGLSPFPGAWTRFDGRVMKVFRSIAIEKPVESGTKPGDFHREGSQLLAVWTIDGWVELQEVQLEGKRRMGVKELLNGLGPAGG